MNDRARRVIADCREIAAMTEEPGRITRRFLTAPVREVHAWLITRMESAGMQVRVDAVGNLRGVWPPSTIANPRLVMGSHIDTVPNAGAFDGVLGVILALHLAELARERNLILPIELIAFSDEEGVRFEVPFLGSRAVAGRFDNALLALKDSDGITLEEAIRAFGLDPAGIQDAKLDENAIAFVEFHIEQGPVLEAENLQVAAVTGIVGQSWLTVKFAGQANHAGTTPMHLRRDALAGAAEWIAAVEAQAQSSDGLVATVGKVAAEPNAGNVVPGYVQVSLDVRHLNDRVRHTAVEEMLRRAEAIALRRNLTVESVYQMDQPAVPMDERLTSFLTDAMEAAGLPAKTMPSGAGHDAMVMATRLPTAMLFLRSPGGISHHPDEKVLEIDVEAALTVGLQFLQRLALEVR